MTIRELLISQAAQRGQAAALTPIRGSAVSYDQLLASIDMMRRRLHAMGIGKGDRVAIVLPNGPAMAMTFLGVASTATAAPLNPTYRAAEFEFFFDDLKPKALIVADPASAVVAVAEARNVRVIPASIADVAADFSATPMDGGEAPGTQDVALILHTSGTTSRPKMVPLTHANLCASAHHISQWLELTPDDCCLNVMPLFHIHGLVAGLLASLAGGGNVVCSPGFVATEFFDWLRRLRPTWYTAVPTMHQAILARGEADRSLVQKLGLRFVRSSSAALSPKVAERLHELFGVPVIEAYGMTEAAHQMCSNPRAAGAQRFESVGLPAGPEVAIMNEAGELLPRGQSGEVVIRGENVTAGYVANPKANASAFTHGWFRTGDLGCFDPDGYLYLSARIKEIINRGGEKISPREVDEVLLEHPAVAEALTFAIPDLRLGEEVGAAVVLRSGKRASEPQLAEFVAKRLADFKVPRRIVFLDEIPKGPTGKLQRFGMAKRLGLESTKEKSASPRTEPKTNTEIALAAIWRTVLRIDAVSSSDHFFHVGGDSILAAQVIARVRQQWGREMSMQSFFQSPTLADMAVAIDCERVAAPVDIEKFSAARDVPASFAQRRLWFLDRLNPGSAVYNNAHAFRIKGTLLTSILRRSLQRIVDRHDALRMRFESVDGRPIIRAALPGELSVPRTDLSGLPPEERQERADRLMSDLASEPFDLSNGPLLRLHLLKLSESEHTLVYIVHHIVSDRWSLGVVARELMEFYEAEQLSESPSPVGLPISYAHYAARQHHSRRAQSLQPLLDYWCNHLGAAPSAFELPSDHPRPAVQSSRGDTHRFEVPQALTRALRELAQAHGATLNMLLLAAFEVLLFRYTRQEDAVLGTALAGRDCVELEDVVGLFINVLPVRCSIRPDTKFSDLLARTKADAIKMLDHQDVPLDELVESLDIPGDASRSPLFQAVFNFHNVPAPPPNRSGLEIEVADIVTATARFDLTLTLRPSGDGLSAAMEYRCDLFDSETIQQLAENFGVLLEGIVADPAAAVGNLPLLTQRQRHQLLVEWNSTGTDAAPDECIAQMFERQAQLKPDALALIAGPDRISYRQLNERANQVAHQLRSLGVGPETLVAVCLPRCARLLVAIIGVLKSGGAYVPLDPNYPKSRLAHMLEDSQAAVLLTEQGLADTLPSAPRHIVCFDRDAAELSLRPTTNLPQLSGPTNLAYVIYTSGSTGKPKGVAIEQAGPAAFVKASRAFAGDHHLMGVLCAASACFDLSVFEIFVPLCRGGAVIVAANGLELAKCAGAEQVTCIYMVPSVMTEALHIGGLPASIRVILLGGEAVPENLVRRCLSLPGVELVYNLYGPTEDTVSSTGYRVLPDSVGPPPIGRPFGGSRTYILDEHRQPVPVGVSGELYLGGIKLARGYLRRPELTAEKFMPDPFGPPGARMYSTGDLCRHRRDGNIECLGRIDHQIKLRGFRIELSEIDAVLSQHPDVRQCSTTVLGDNGDARLVAYLTAMDTRRPGVGELRRHLAGHLPEYMVPARFVFLPSMPMDPNGKIDRRALPAVEPEEPSSEIAWAPPTTATQQQLAAIWSKILDVPRIGLNDNFFHLGGHSLRAMIAMGQIEQTIGIELPVRMFFEHPTLAALAEAIESRRADLTIKQTAPAVPAPREDRRLSHAQQRMWVQHRLTVNSGVYNVTIAQKLIGPLDAAKLEGALGEVIGRHETLRTSFPDTDGVPWPAIVPAAVAKVKISIVDCSSRPLAAGEADVRRIIDSETRKVFDLSRWPLMRAWLIHTGAGEHVFVLTMHHIICDDWSLRILFEEMSQLYSGGPALPALSAQYGDFAVWQDGWTATGAFAEEVRYWKSQMAGAPLLLELHTDRPRPAVQAFEGVRQPLCLDREITRGLHTLAKEEHGTVFMSLLAASSALLMRWTGQTDIVIGAPISNRHRPEFQHLIGLFLNMQPMRMKLDGDPTFRQLLQRARKTALDAYANQNLPFEMLVDHLLRRRNPRYSPLFQVMLVHLTESPPRLGLPGIRSETIPSDDSGAKIDLTLYFNEQDGRIEGSIEYNTDLFDRSTVRDLIDQLVLLLRSVLANPDCPLSRLPMSEQIVDRRPHARAITSEPSDATAPALHPITRTEQTLMEIWRETLGISSVGVNDDFFELGGTSFLAVRVFAQIERRLGISLPLATLFLAPTIAQLACRLDIADAPGSAPSSGVIPLRPGVDGPPVFCLSGAGGHVFMFQKLASLLKTDCAIYGLQLDGSAPNGMEDIAATCIDRMRQAQPHGPYRLIGYSFGGALAYEMSQQLSRAGQIIELLVLIDAFVPGSMAPKPLFHRMGVHLRRLTSGGVHGALDHARLVAGRCRDRLLPHQIHPKFHRSQTLPDQRNTIEEAIKQIEGANTTANHIYRPVPYAGNVVLFHATQRDPWRDFHADPHLNGWSGLVRGKLAEHGVPGTHQTLFDEPNVRQLARKIEEYLAHPSPAVAQVH